MTSTALSSQRPLGAGRLVAAALIGGAISVGVAYFIAAAMPWLFRTNGVFPYTVPELLVQDITAIAAGSAVLAVPVSLVLGVPILYGAFRWTTRPVAVATTLGGLVGPILLGSILAVGNSFTSNQPLPHGITQVFICVGLLGIVGAFVAVQLLSTGSSVTGRKSAA
jgi:hypothetical protein